MRKSVKWIALIIGTTIGAGYASGRELWQFFGLESDIAIILFACLFTFSCYIIFTISYKTRAKHYMPLLEIIVGKKMAKFYDIMILFYLFMTTTIMIAGSGATAEGFYLPYWWGVFFIVILLVLIFIKGINMILMVNQIVLPILIAGLGYILLAFLLNNHISLSVNWQEQANWIQAFPFAALNTLALISVLGAVGYKVNSQKEVIITSVSSGLILGILSFIYNKSLIHIADDILVYDIPLFSILKDMSYGMFILMSILLWIALFTTALSGILGLVSRIQSKLNIPLWLIVIFLILSMLPFTAIGFSLLIQYIYPFYGFLNLYILARLILFPFRKQ